MTLNQPLSVAKPETKTAVATSIPQRWLGSSGLSVKPVALGLWPVAGMTTLGANEADSLATIEAACDAGINFFDTAWCYGVDGISERLLGQVAQTRRAEMVIATKCGIHWAPDGTRINDASPRRLDFECRDSLRRMKLEQVDLLYLHSADGRTPVAESATALLELQRAGLTRAVGASNLSLEDLQVFESVCPLSAVQYRFNLLQREIMEQIVPWCLARKIAVVVYWPLMKGLLGGKMRRDWQFDPHDKRLQYPMFHPPEWEWNQQLLDRLERIANEAGLSLPQLVIGWTIAQPGISAALCGAKRPWQIRETALALDWIPTPEFLKEVEAAVAERMMKATGASL